MSLITRGGKGSKLTIEEMDGNLIHLNNNPLLLGKITADLNTATASGNVLLITFCTSFDKTVFLPGEKVTLSLIGEGGFSTKYATAELVSIELSPVQACFSRGDSVYVLELAGIDADILKLPDGLTVAGDTSGATALVSQLVEDTFGVAQPIQLNPNGQLFKINEIILTGINGEPDKSTSCWVKTGPDAGGDTLASLAPGGKLVTGGVAGLKSPAQWVAMQLGSSGTTAVADDVLGQVGEVNASGVYDYLVGNTLYFSADTAAGSPCTVDVYVFGYTIA